MRVVGLVGSAREARAAGRSRPVAGELRRRRPGPRRRRRRGRRAVLERHQPGTARRADPRRAGAGIAICTSTRACRASTSGACRRCRSPTSRCSTSSRRRCRRCRSRSSGRSTSPSRPSCCSCCRRSWSAIAVAVKLTDRGPVLFRQRRVGRDGVEFEILKFRSMCVDAEARLAALRAEHNERSGPLFKLERDPRVTTIGPLHPCVQPRRAAAAAQRAARRDEPRRPAAGAAVGGRRVPGRPPRPPPRAARHHRPVAGRGAGQPVVRAPTAASICSTSTTGRCCSTS